MRKTTSAKHSGQERIEELCMLAALGELPLEDAPELHSHLAGCADCRAQLESFQRMGIEDLPLVAATRAGEEIPDTPADEDLELQRALSRVLQGAQRSASGSPQSPPLKLPIPISAPTSVSHWRTRLMYAAAALIFCFTGATFYHVYLLHRGSQQSAISLAQQIEYWKLQSKYWRLQASTSAAQKQEAESSLLKSQANADQLQRSLQREQEQGADLVQVQKALEARIAAGNSENSSLNQELLKAEAKLAQEQESRTQMSLQIQDLKMKAKSNEPVRQAGASPAPLLKEADRSKLGDLNFTDPEARGLFGARDLHIVDVMDVNSSGKTGKVYGRVYYVNHNLLLFYAFDLQDATERSPIGFQAWGFRDPNSSKLENLGMFKVDDPSLNRWALKVTDSAILSRIDTVFVTVEPPGGSARPKGKKILFAILAGPPNHP